MGNTGSEGGHGGDREGAMVKGRRNETELDIGLDWIGGDARMLLV